MAASPTSKVNKGKGKHRTVVTSDPESDQDDSVQAKAAPFPLAMTFFDDPGGSKDSRAAGSSKARRKSRRAHSESDEDEDEDGIQGKVAPFPLGTQFFHDIGSPTTARHFKSQKKRLSEGLDSDDPSPRKRSKGDASLFDDDDDEPFEEESFFISSTTDPKTLCPYCDNPLPSSPSPALVKMLEAMLGKSYRDPRPANPLGRKAPFATFIDLCHRHQFESKILPEAEKKGWPKVIDWDSLSARIENMQSELQKLIDDTSDKGPRSRSPFWQDIMKAIKVKGLRAATGVKDQFENFEKTQPGYYGELGTVIINQTLYDMFPPASIQAQAIAPLGAEEFLQRILIPEAALRLIMEDKGLKGSSGRQTALQVLRESSSYGVAMFPADGTDPMGGGGRKSTKNEEGLTAGETIIMERARRRRKEIEEEDAREEAAEAERARMMQVDTVQQKSKPRPRPRPVGKGASKSSMMDLSKTDDENIFTADESDGRPEHRDTDPIEVDVTDYGADHSESDADSEIIVSSRPQRTRKSRSPPLVRDDRKSKRSTSSRAGSVKPSRPRKASSSVNGWSSNYDSEYKRKSANVARNRRRRQETRREESDGDPDSEVPSIVEIDPDDAPASNAKTPKPRMKNSAMRKPLLVEDEATPRPSRSIAPSSSQADLPPLLKAKALAEARKKAAAAVKDPDVDEDEKDRSIPVNSRQAQGGKGKWVHSMRADYLGKNKKSSQEDSSEDEDDSQPDKDKSHSWLLISDGPRLPAELFDNIIYFFVEAVAQRRQFKDVRLYYADIVCLRLCSRAFNHSTLRHAFRTTVILNSGIWFGVCKLLYAKAEEGRSGGVLAGFAWVRELEIRDIADVLTSPTHILRFDALVSLSLDFARQGLNTQLDCVKRFFSVFDTAADTLDSDSTALASHGISQSLRHLRFTKLPAIEISLLRFIARVFPALVSLEIDSASRLNVGCCTGCFEDSLTLTVHSPVSRRFHSAEALAMAYGEALQPLTSLKRLYLGIFLSPEELVENHVDFLSSATVKVLNVLEKMSQQDCEKCQALFEPLAYQELLASLRVAQYVKSLETIGWETWCDYSNRTHYGGQRRPVDDQLEGALEGSHTVIRVNSKASRAEELEGGSQDLAMEVEDDAGSSQASDASSVSQSSSTMDSDSQVSIAPYLNGDKGGRPGIPRAGFRLNMKVIREAQRVRIQRLEPNLNQ
ncbi:hypothetical protein H1R20_g7620, partial [Candolleomyces eurysporus]